MHQDLWIDKVDRAGGRMNCQRVELIETGVTMTASQSETSSSLRWLLGLILLLAVVVRVGWGLSRPTTRESMQGLPDQLEYLSLGENLLHQGELSMVDGRFESRVYAYRTPGYPVFIAMCGASVRAVYLVQGLLDASAVLACYLLARRWLTAGGAMVSAALVALNPWLIFYTGTLLSETLYIALLAWGLCLMCRPGRHTLGWHFFAGIILLAASAMVRPSGLALVPVEAALAVLAFGRVAGEGNHREWFWRCRAMFMGMLAAVILIIAIFLPWAVRNYVRPEVGQWVWTTTNVGVTAYDGFGPGADGGSDQSRLLTDLPELGQMHEAERSNYLQSLATGQIRQDPARAMALAWRKIVRTWSLLPHADQAQQARYQWAAAVHGGVLFGLAIVGLLRKQLPWPAKLLLAAPAVYFTLVVASSVGSIRYRTPAEWPLAIVAGSAVCAGRRNRAATENGGSSRSVSMPGKNPVL